MAEGFIYQNAHFIPNKDNSDLIVSICQLHHMEVIIQNIL